MRLVLLALFAIATPGLATLAQAGPLDKGGPGRSVPAEGSSILSQPDRAEAAAQQAEFDRKIAERSNRAARSICAGCSSGSIARGASVTPSVRNPGLDEPRPVDPAEAPLD